MYSVRTATGAARDISRVRRCPEGSCPLQRLRQRSRPLNSQASHTSDLVVRPRQRLKSIAMLHQASVYHKSMLDAEEWKKKMRATDVWQQLRDQRLPRQLDAGEWDAAVTELEAATRGLVSTEAEAEAARAALREALRRAKAAEAVAAAQRQAVLPAEQQEAEVVRLVHAAANSLTSLMAARAARKEAAELREQTEQLQNERLHMQQQIEQLQRASLARKFSPRTDSKSSAVQEHIGEQHSNRGSAIEPCSLSDAFAAVLLDEQHVPAVHMPVASWPCGGGEGTAGAAPTALAEGSSGVSKADASASCPHVTRSLLWAAESEASTEAPSDYELVRSQTAVPRLAATRVQANWRGAKVRLTAI